jgi:hypothetical protein
LLGDFSLDSVRIILIPPDPRIESNHEKQKIKSTYGGIKEPIQHNPLKDHDMTSRIIIEELISYFSHG